MSDTFLVFVPLQAKSNWQWESGMVVSPCISIQPSGIELRLKLRIVVPLYIFQLSDWNQIQIDKHSCSSLCFNRLTLYIWAYFVTIVAYNCSFSLTLDLKPLCFSSHCALIRHCWSSPSHFISFFLSQILYVSILGLSLSLCTLFLSNLSLLNWLKTSILYVFIILSQLIFEWLEVKHTRWGNFHFEPNPLVYCIPAPTSYSFTICSVFAATKKADSLRKNNLLTFIYHLTSSSL